MKLEISNPTCPDCEYKNLTIIKAKAKVYCKDCGLLFPHPLKK